MEDIEIARSANIKEIETIANKLNISDIDLYGKYKCKINSISSNKDGKVVLVTATNPTEYGEGKTTTSIGLLDALCKSVNAIGVLREPSLGPVFGIKGGATGGGYSQVIPMEDINLHFTGDFHAITTANNLLCAAIDNHIKQGNYLNIQEVLFNRCLDINDRELKSINIASGRSEVFTITAASEMMAILCMSKDINDLRNKLESIIIGVDNNGKYIYAKELNIVGSLLVLLKDAIKPNLVQTLENNPVIIHGGPFANIASGTSSISSIKLAKKLSDYVVTEAGFGSDCGAIKYYDLLARDNSLKPNAIVIVTSIRSLDVNGIENLIAHINIVKRLTNNIVVCLNKFNIDSESSINKVKEVCEENNVLFSISECYLKGSDGAGDLSNKVIELCKNNEDYQELYSLNDSIEDKVSAIVKDIYLAKNITYSDLALKKLQYIKDNNLTNLPICIAKTQYSISDNKELLGYPTDFDVTVKDIKVCNGAGFIVIYLGNILTMPGLSKHPNYEQIDLKDNEIIGLF